VNLSDIHLVQLNLAWELKIVDQEIDPVLLDEIKERMEWITHKGKEILYENYSNLNGDEVSRRVPIFSHLELQIGKKDMLLIIDLSNSFASKAALSAFTKAGNVTVHLFTKTAVFINYFK